MRLHLLQATELDWSKVSPAIFGSMFQGVMDEKQRRNLGAHYTSERNILRLIKPLFLDDLYEEFNRVRHNRNQLETFHEKLASLNFLDPACGCGNFLVITYRELRRLEHKVVQLLLGGKQALDLHDHLKVDVDQMHGIEIEEFPAMIAQTALWLTDHQMNVEASKLLGQTFTRLPLTASANIANVNALTTEWADVVPPENLNYILGNPPFIGHHLETNEQKALQRKILHDIPAAGVLDFVSCWYYKALDFIDGTSIPVALVSTNSITQGEQAAILWERLLAKGARINFAHRTFKWSNEGRGVAAVFCVIIGFALQDRQNKMIFDYPDIRADPLMLSASNINPYLVDAPDLLVTNRATPVSNAPPLMYGSKPTDGGHFLFTDAEKKAFLRVEPNAEKFIKPYISAREYLHGDLRWTLWLIGADPSDIRKLPKVLERVESVRAFRTASKAPTTRAYPHHTLFRQVTQSPSDYVMIPAHSSENRDYIPMGFLSKDEILNNSAFAVVGATLFHFGILTSTMHMAWVRAVCGRLESRYRYSKDIVYNNFPWPDNVSESDRERIERLAQSVLDARAMYPSSTLADLYDPNTMPPPLVKAHRDLDRAVDRLYRK